MDIKLSSKSIIDSKMEDLLNRSQTLTRAGLKPKLAVILVGENPASLLYVNNKKKRCEQIEAEFELIKLDSDVSEIDFLAQVDKINNDQDITGCFVQLPVPKHLQHINITQMINPKKDVDGFHEESIHKLYQGDLTGNIACTPRGIITLLSSNKIAIAGKNVVIIGRSYIVGKPLSLLMQALDATVTLCHSKTKDLIEHTQKADIIVSAVGIPKFITKEHLSSDRKQVIIDVGINKVEDKTVGDVDFDEVAPLVYAITPVPGGVGPMTVFSLMENLLKTTENILGDRQG